jgi:serine/threonine protein kinase
VHWAFVWPLLPPAAAAAPTPSSPHHRAPEHGFPGHKRPNQDIWSVGILVAELAAGRPLYDASVKNRFYFLSGDSPLTHESVRNREILKIYGDVSHALHPAKLHKTMPELQGMSDAFHDFLDEVRFVSITFSFSLFLMRNNQVFLSSAERPFAVDLIEHNIWLEGQVRRFHAWSTAFLFCLLESAFPLQMPVAELCLMGHAADLCRVCRVA